MSKHVDLVKNEWLAGMQVRLATATETDSGHQLSSVTPGWEDLLTRPLTDQYGNAVYLAKEPLDAIPRHYNSEYVFATEVHDESDCPFRYGEVVVMAPLPDPSAASS